MNTAILNRARTGTLVAAAILGLVLGLLQSPRFGIGVAATAAWTVAGFWVLERLLRSAVVPPNARRNGWAVLGWILTKLALYVVAGWALLQSLVPVWSVAIGLTLLLVVLVVVGITLSSHGTDQPARRGDDG